MLKVFKKLILPAFLLVVLHSCEEPVHNSPEPHLELGQRMIFVGAEPEKAYVIVGYRSQLEDKTDKEWKGQEYVVFVYINDQGDVKEAVIHRNAILKR